MRRRLIVLSVIGATAFVAAGCGDDDEGRVDVSGGTDTTGTSTTGTSTEAAAGGSPVDTIDVALAEFRLSPANPSVSKAGVVEFNVTNAGKAVHTLEVEGPEGEVETDSIDPGKSATLKADLGKAGRYKWYCPIGDHEDRGMKGEITVAGGGGEKKEDKEAGPDGHGGY
jgi:uncharacterized cupredoxin-like copper-binding protein